MIGVHLKNRFGKCRIRRYNLIAMTTFTMQVDDELLARASQLAAARQMTLAGMVERLLRVVALPPLRHEQLPPSNSTGTGNAPFFDRSASGRSSGRAASEKVRGPMIVLVDTNILLDVLQERHPHDAPAARVWKLSEERSITAYVFAISFNNVFYVARKQAGRDQPARCREANSTRFQTARIDEKVIDRAINDKSMTDFEDAIQVACAPMRLPNTSSAETLMIFPMPHCPP